MVISEIQLFEVLAQELGREKATSLVEFVEAKVEKRLDEKTSVFATKEDLANTKAALIKWMFIFWIGQLASFVAIAKFLLK